MRVVQVAKFTITHAQIRSDVSDELKCLSELFLGFHAYPALVILTAVLACGARRNMCPCALWRKACGATYVAWHVAMGMWHGHVAGACGRSVWQGTAAGRRLPFAPAMGNRHAGVSAFVRVMSGAKRRAYASLPLSKSCQH